MVTELGQLGEAVRPDWYSFLFPAHLPLTRVFFFLNLTNPSTFFEIQLRRPVCQETTPEDSAVYMRFLAQPQHLASRFVPSPSFLPSPFLWDRGGWRACLTGTFCVSSAKNNEAVHRCLWSRAKPLTAGRWERSEP